MTNNFHGPAFLPRTFVQDARSNPAKWKSESVAFFGTFNTGTILTGILHSSCLLQFSSPRDMIYALLGVIDGMSRTADLFDISVNYDIKVVDLYVSVFKICIENVPALATLSMVTDRRQRITEGLPSWVPDLAALAGLVHQKRLGLFRPGFESPPYNAAFMSARVPISRSVEGNVLDLRGFYLGDINAYSLDLSGRTIENTPRHLISLLDVCLALPTILRDGQDRIQGLWRTMVADSEYSLRPAPPELGACFHDWILKALFFIRKYEVEWASVLSIIFEKITQLSENTVTLISLPNVGVGSLWRGRVMVTREGSTNQEIAKYVTSDNLLKFEKLISAVYAQLLFRTNGGDLGYGPLSTSPGDQIWVLENGRVPFVLRPVADGKNFELLGECYVHGVMDGQLFSKGMPVYENISLV